MAIESGTLRDWHRLFGLLLTDFFTGSPFIVEIERDLSQQKQLLDVVIVRRGRGAFIGRLPDGLENLAAHNLITFKSLREALDSWAMKELVGHYVAYRKVISPSPADLLPEGDFRQYAICSRFPHNLSGQVPWQKRQQGVYHCQWGTDEVRVIVAGELPREEHNAPLHLFSASPELVTFGQGAFQQRSENTSSLLGQLLQRFRKEGLAMPYTMKDFQRDYAKEYFPQLTPEEQLEVLKRLSPEAQQEIIQALSPEARLAGLPPEARLAGLPPEARLAGLSKKQIQQYLDHLTAHRSADSRKGRRKK
jgi:hypothetical protein